MRLALFLLLLCLAPSLGHPLLYNPLRDLLFYFNNPTLLTLLSAFGNYLWGLYLSPWVGGRAMVEA